MTKSTSSIWRDFQPSIRLLDVRQDPRAVRGNRGRQTAIVLLRRPTRPQLPEVALLMFFSTSSTLNLAGFYRGGNYLKVPMNPATISWMAITEKSLR